MNFRFVFIVTSAIFAVVFGSEDAVLAKNMKYRLPSGDLMPLVGFGTYQVRGYDLIKETLDHALAAGYRLIDTAKVYENEEDIGRALKELLPKYNLTRKDIWITTKLAPGDQGATAYRSLQESVRKLGTGYVDLYLIHWPGVFNNTMNSSSLRDESWRLMVQGVKDGLARNIGVSNYLVRHLNELLRNDHGIKPAVNQVEWHPHYHPEDLLEFCRQNGILLQAYSSLGGTGNTDLLKDPKVVEIAKKLGKSSAQVLLRWALQQSIGIIPKARSAKYIVENIDLNFVIPDEDMTILNSFPKNKYAWDPDSIA